MDAGWDKINILIVDDEAKARENIKNLLYEFADFNINVVGMAGSTREAEILVKTLKPDAVFLDIQMPHENAFHFLDRIMPIDFDVVFITAYDQYAIRAFKLNAVDYILKPINIHELRNTVQKLKKQKKLKWVENSLSFSELFNQGNDPTGNSGITLKGTDSLERIELSDVIFFEAQTSYSRVLYLKKNIVKEILVSYPLSYYEDILPAKLFYRIHRSYLANCNYIRKIVHKDEVNWAIMHADHSLPISRRRFPLLIDFLKSNGFNYD